MGCQIGSNGSSEVELRWSRAGYLVMSLTRRWIDNRRDCDSDGYHQVSIDASSMRLLNAEAPTAVAEFRNYCVEHAPDNDVARMHADELIQIREFITDADRLGQGVWCSH